MKQRLIALLTSSIVPLIALTFLFVLVAPTAAVDHTVGGGCGDTIQDCIDFASAGDTVIIPDGLYKENIVLDKAVSLQGESTEGVMLRTDDLIRCGIESSVLRNSVARVL